MLGLKLGFVDLRSNAPYHVAIVPNERTLDTLKFVMFFFFKVKCMETGPRRVSLYSV